MSPGAETGATITDALDLFEERGYGGQFRVDEGGGLRCLSCNQTALAGRFAVHDLYRIEGTSDPDDEALVAALQCPGCEALGSAVFAYGPHASANELEVVGALAPTEPSQ